MSRHHDHPPAAGPRLPRPGPDRPRPRLLGFGSALVDELVHVPEAFLGTVPGLKGGSCLAEHHELESIHRRHGRPVKRAPGGAAANTVRGAAELGMAAGLLAKTGEDEAGRFYREAMRQSRVAVDRLKSCPEQPTGRCLSLITPDSQRTMRTCLGAAASLAPAELAPADFAGYTHFYVEGYLLFNRDLLLHALGLAKAAGLQVCLDLASPEVVAAGRDILPRLLQEHVAAVFANEDEANAFAGGRGEEAGLAALAEHCPVAVVKLGRRGAWIRHGGGTVHAPAHPVQALDTTGAGDLWAAGFLHAWLHGADFATAGDFGARVAAAVVQVTGAEIPAAEWQRLRREAPAGVAER
ncbi:MAG: adenosine kinase [Lentisphaeria bacterium]|jgi:sugar/nucleoside kinase (ribokinase family)